MWFTPPSECLYPETRPTRTHRVRASSEQGRGGVPRLRVEALEHREAPSSVFGDPFANWCLPLSPGYDSSDRGDLFAAVQALRGNADGSQAPALPTFVHDQGEGLGYGGGASLTSGEPTITLGGRGTVIHTTALGVINVTAADTGPLPSEGGLIEVFLARANISLGLAGSLRAELLYAETHGEGIWAGASASATNLDLTVLGNRIVAHVLRSEAMVDCWDGGTFTEGGSEVLNLSVNGTAVTVTGEPNQTIRLGVGWIVINELESMATETEAAVTARALHVVVPGVVDVAISTAHAECALVW